MKRLLKIGLYVALALPAGAFAQDLGGDTAAQQHTEPAGHAAGIVRGSVIWLDLSAGTLRVQAGRGTMTLEATPAQLTGLNPGDFVEFPYNDYEGHLWLSPEVGSGRSEMRSGYSSQGRFTGVVQAMARGSGTVTVRGTTYRTHPSQLQGVRPGMLVDVIYNDIGGVSWAEGIMPLEGFHD